MIFVDANVLVSAILGRQTRRVLTHAVESQVALAVPEAQLDEALRVLTDRLGFGEAEARSALTDLASYFTPVASEFYRGMEAAARQRLHARAQPDWPVLAAALAADGAIWTNDRDFFGVGAPVWSTRNLRFAE